jgi:hypothetical protein
MHIEKMHTQFVNDSQHLHKDKVFPSQGRYILHLGNNHSISIEWNIWSEFCHLYIGRNFNDLTFGIAVPPFSLWFVYDGFRASINRRVGIHVRNGGIDWNLWADTMSWSKKTPRWKDGHIALVELLLGRTRYESFPIEERIVSIPMPEGIYKAVVHHTEDVWRRRWWTCKRVKRVKMEMKQGIPVPGKGTCSYNCGNDAIYSMSCPANNIARGVGHLVGSILQSRVQYGGYSDWTWPTIGLPDTKHDHSKDKEAVMGRSVAKVSPEPKKRKPAGENKP